MQKSVIMIDGKKNSTTEVAADLNALFLMVSYVELELERIAPDCTLVASSLRSSIFNEILLRASNYSDLLNRPIAG